MAGERGFRDFLPAVIAVVSAEGNRKHAAARRFAQETLEMPLVPALFQRLPVGGKVVDRDAVFLRKDRNGTVFDAADFAVFQIQAF